MDCDPPRQFRGAVIAGLKVSKKASERNRVKRRIHAAIREYRQNQILTGDFVLILNKEIVNAHYQQIKSELTKCLNIFCKTSSSFIKKPSRPTMA